jgi:hypothetical protein
VRVLLEETDGEDSVLLGERAEPADGTQRSGGTR